MLGIASVNIPNVQARKGSTTVKSHNRHVSHGKIVKVKSHVRHYKHLGGASSSVPETPVPLTEKKEATEPKKEVSESPKKTIEEIEEDIVENAEDAN